MYPTLTCLALAFVGGVDYGYQPSPDGKALELIVQIDPVMFRTLRPGDPIRAAFGKEIEGYRVSDVIVAVENTPPPRNLPTSSSAVTSGAHTAPATAPNVPASRLPSSVMPATATSPLPNSGPALEPSAEQGPARVAPPTGPPAAPTTTNEQTQGAADPRAGSTLAPGSPGGNASFPNMPPVDNGNSSPVSFDRWQLVLYLAIIALAASNGYVGWLFYDARQRYLALLSRKFATAS